MGVRVRVEIVRVRVRRAVIPTDRNSRFERISNRGTINGESQIILLGVEKK